MQKNITRILKTLFILLSASVLFACSKPLPEVTAHDFFIYELAPDKTSAKAYVTLKNNSERMHALNYVHSPLAEYVEIRHIFHNQSQMESRPVKRIRVSPGETKILRPDGYHMVIFGLYDPLKPGDHFDITLEFETGHVIETQVEVRSRG